MVSVVEEEELALDEDEERRLGSRTISSWPEIATEALASQKFAAAKTEVRLSPTRVQP